MRKRIDERTPDTVSEMEGLLDRFESADLTEDDLEDLGLCGVIDDEEELTGLGIIYG